MDDVRAVVLTQTSLYDAEGRLVAHLAPQDLIAVRVTNDETVTLLLVDRALLERGGVVRVGG